jgi:hypothetical protein
MKDPFLNQRIVQLQSDSLKLLWKGDLLSPTKVGRCFSRTGLRVLVSQENIDAADSHLAKGASDVLFTGHRKDDASGNDAHFVLVPCEVAHLPEATDK